ncbi:PREDICTED: sodium channel protein Nach [Ceratosolen solmsi marchali]|uniref:Sodium channel protein Nach n=1 Tax=Ceratosolen solmsi marchali TaxID=326594 RepID=A0AAJ6YI57_9HYME|nr:PREDICTED: sodium channel protein Nach [Ceratosolen solmsi marchali]
MYLSTDVVTCLCCSVGFLRAVWKYNSAYSTLTVIATMHHGIWNYPFPAVTFCNNNQISSRKVQEFVKNLTIVNNLSREFILDEMKLLLEMLDPDIFEDDLDSNFTVLQDIFDVNNYSISHIMSLVRQDCSNLLKSCKWKGTYVPCHEIFHESYSRDGLCCSFNYFNSESTIEAKTVPKRLTACGYQTGLTVLIDAEPDDYYSSLYGSYGVKVMIHYPYNYPDRSSEYKLIGLGVQSFLAIAPQEVYSTAAVKNLPLSARQCIFEDEILPKELQVLMRTVGQRANYSYVNCLNRCRISIIENECGCFPYYSPQNRSRECNLRDIRCLSDIKSLIDTSWPGINVNHADLTTVDIDIRRKPCGCLFDCSIYRYPVDASEGIIDTEQFYGDRIKESSSLKNYSVVNIFYVDFISTQYRREVYYNWKNFFASFGGLLGLSVGFSLISAFELLYFFVVRVIVDICIARKNERAERNVNQ